MSSFGQIEQGAHYTRKSFYSMRKAFLERAVVEVSQYAVMHGNAAAIRHFSEDLGEIKEGTLRGWKVKYLAVLRLKQENGENDLTVKSLPIKKLAYQEDFS